MTAPLPGIYADEQAFLDSVEGEISFFRSIMRARPLGKHRHFHILTIRNSILRDTGRSVHIESIWEKLRRCYNIGALEVEVEAETLPLPKPNPVGATSMTATSTDSTTPVPLRSPSPSENLARQPCFAEEFSLPYEDFESLFAQRRMRETASLPSSPAPTPGTVEGAPRPANAAAGNTTSRRASASSPIPPISAGTTTRAGKRKLAKSKLNLAGLVGGDSDSSALTQESGDEGGEGEGSGVSETPKESVVTGTGGTDADGRTEDGEEEDTEMREASSVRESPRPMRGRGAKAGGRRGRGAAGGTRGSSTRGKKKQKR